MIKLNSKESSDKMESIKLTTSKCGGSFLLKNKINIYNKYKIQGNVLCK